MKKYRIVPYFRTYYNGFEVQQLVFGMFWVTVAKYQDSIEDAKKTIDILLESPIYYP